MGRRIQRIVRDHFEAYRTAQRRPLSELKAARAICRCRTAALGGHVQKCPNGHIERVWYNSCRHRACPMCAFLRIQRWVGRQMTKLLACDYYHVILTLPEELRGLWRYNRAAFAQVFFQAGWHSVRELLADPNYLGALPGVLATLHTWSQALYAHPHLHLLVTAGGMKPDGRWIHHEGKVLLPTRVLRDKFRGKFLAFLRKALETGNLVIPPEIGSLQRCRNLLNKLGRMKWNVNIRPRYTHARGVLLYLSRYVTGGPISDRRIVGYDGDHVLIGCRSDGVKPRIVRLRGKEFLARLLLHVPPPGLHIVRSYGLFANAKTGLLNRARAVLGQREFTPAQDAGWQEICEQPGSVHPHRCPVCGATLLVIRTLPPVRPDLKRREAA